MVWGSGMKKISSLGGITPLNTLNGRNGTASSPPRPTPPLSGKLESNPPPPKRQRIQESTTDTHTEAHFALLPESEGFLFPDPVVPRKRSASDSISASDTPHTISGQSSSKSSSQNITELRQVEKYIQPPRAKRPRHKPSKKEVEEVDIDSDEDRDHLALDGEVQGVEFQGEVAIWEQQPRKLPHEDGISLDFIRNRFQPTTRVPSASSATRKRPFPDNNIDELSMDADDGSRTKLSMSGARPKSLSLSTDGDVKPTKFTGTKSKPRQSRQEPMSPSDQRDAAAAIVNPGLEVSRAADGQHGFEVFPEPDGCFLSIRQMSFILHPTNRHHNGLDRYSYLTINLQTLHKVIVATNPLESRIVRINRPVDARNSSGAKIYIEFSSSADVQKLLAWADSRVSVFHKPASELEKELKKGLESVVRSTVITDKDKQLPEDIKLMARNAEARSQRNATTIPTPNRSQAPFRRKLKDQMQSTASSTAGDDAYEIPESPPGPREPHPVRTTRAMFVPKDPTPEPELPSWTASNPGWEQRWRNSLIFPPHGKSRAIVDKADIERLNEGQFLNDNIIIFYLRYLQNKLETELPDQAQKIYFQNTFFFDKLKPTKTGGAINYDSVKSWTSKVDLFTKDYIVVPINEYAHWYVAIIYNAPKLITGKTGSSDAHTQPKDSIIIEDDGKPPQVESTHETPDQAGEDSSAQNEVEAGISRMSIHSSDIVETKAKQADDTKYHAPPEATEASKDNTVNLTQGSDDPSPEAEHAQQSPGNLSRKKAAKKQGSGPRRYDPDQPRIITLDSLGGSHSPACNYLKQYLVAELKDKKGVEIPIPGALGMTAKNNPLQFNYCDCGLYLLGYIEAFLRDPDNFTRSILQHEQIQWDLDPSNLRNRIRGVLFELQDQQQKREDAHKEEKRQAALSKKPKTSRPSSSDEPRARQSSAKPRHEPENPSSQVVERSDHDTRLEVESAVPKVTAEPKATADLSPFFHPVNNKAKMSSTKEHPSSLLDSDEPSIAQQLETSCAVPEHNKQQSPPLRNFNSGHESSSFPASPHKTNTRATIETIEIPSQEETLPPSHTEKVAEVEKGFPSPLKSSPRSSTPKQRDAVIDVDRDPGEKPADSRRESIEVDPVISTPKKLANGTHSGSPRRFHRAPSKSQSHASLSPRETTESRNLAGRQDGDTKARAKCNPKQRDYVELSD